MSGEESIINFDTSAPLQHQFRLNNAGGSRDRDESATASPESTLTRNAFTVFSDAICYFFLPPSLWDSPRSLYTCISSFRVWRAVNESQDQSIEPDAESEPNSVVESLRKTMAEAFAHDLFNGIIPDTVLGGRQRTQFKWPTGIEVSVEDRVLVVLRAIKRAGFSTLGEFLAESFGNDFNKHPTVYHTIASLRAKEKRLQNHPISIIKLIFEHRKSQDYIGGVPVEPNFEVPRYALPPSTRLTTLLPSLPDNITRNAMINWALQCMITRFKIETRELLLPVHGFLHQSKDRALTWDMLLLWDMLRAQKTISVHATAIFVLFTTIAVNRTARAKLEAASSLAMDDPDPDPEESEESFPNDPLPFARTDADLPLEGEPQNSHSSSDGPSLAGISHDQSDGEGEDEPVGSEPNEDPSTGTHSDYSKLYSDSMGRRDPWQAVTVFILILLVFQNHFALMLPIIVRIFLFTCNVHRETIAFLCRLGLSVSYTTVLAQLHVLAADSASQLRFLGAFSPNTGPQFLLLFDNVNKMKRAWRAQLGHQDEVKSGTAATAIRLEGVRPGAFLSEPVKKAIDEKRRQNLTVDKLYDDISWEHIRGIGKGTVLRIWLKYIPALASHRAAVEALFSSTHKKHVLQLRKSEIHTARPTNIDESSSTGVASVLANLLGQLSVVPATLDRWMMLMICGDQLTIDRVRKIKWYSRKAGDPFDKYQWALRFLPFSKIGLRQSF
ncbi:hypothetical protein R3P38DRAFT_3206690 [Favolaschia claudopus]|uniref:DUF6589 domain-containing protein n=1 Tax=Favolaschia claudopus TaxID=2862362 RepID=A0AAW0AKN3_9AGAR